MTNKTFIHTLLFLVAATFTGLVYAGHPVNVNTANATEIAAGLDGVGQKKAEAIVAFRESNGAFLVAEDLADVKGIGSKTVEKNMENIQLN